jgi:4-carboxymuconolactone decarboxylase
MTPEAQAALDEIRKVRGYTLPLHEVMAEANPEFVRRYGDLASYVIFGDGEGRALDLKTRFLVMVGITTAVKGDREGIEWAALRAIKHGASWEEVYEAAFLAGLPAGFPAFEAAAKTLQKLRNGEGIVPQEGIKVTEA